MQFALNQRRQAVLYSRVRYLVKAKVKEGQAAALARAIDDKTLGRGSIAGDEYLYNMNQARVDEHGTATWVETCFCDPPLEEERPYWEKYFELLSVKDAHSRRNCRHENGNRTVGLLQLRLHEESRKSRSCARMAQGFPWRDCAYLKGKP